MPKIALDAGHGLYTAGKQTPTGIKEWTLNDKVRDKVVAYLSSYDVSIINVDNNEGNVDEPLMDRVNRYLREGVDVFVSLHHNAFKGEFANVTGVEVWIDRNATEEDKILANMIYNRLVKYTGLKGRGVKREDFTVINQNKVPAVLIEGGFMDGTDDYKVITSDKGQDAYARAVAESLIEYCKLKKKSVVTKPATPTPTSKFSVGDIVTISADATYYTGVKVPGWVRNKQWIVEKVEGDKIIINKSTDGENAINSPISAKYLTVVKTNVTSTPSKKFEPYMVRIDIPNLNIRKGPSSKDDPTGRYTGKGVFTIVEEKEGYGARKGWGKLKSGAGWISLDYATKI